MFKILFVVIVIFLFLKSNIIRKDGWLNPSTFLILIYFVAIVLTIPNLLINGDSEVVQYTLIYQEKYWQGAIVFVLFLLLFLYPFWYFKENTIQKVILPNTFILNIFSFILILMSFFSMAFFLPSVVAMFRSGTALALLRNNLDTIRSVYANTDSIFNTVATVCSSMYPFVMMLFFIYYIIGGHYRRCLLLFIASFSNVICVLSFMGRDGVVNWIFCFICMYLFFIKYLNERQKREINKVLIVGVILISLPFWAISVSRFSDGSTGTLGGILSYMGQMLPNYCLYFDVHQYHYNYGVSFPLYWEITGQAQPISVRWIDGGTESNVFGTFIKGFNTSFGIWGTVLVGIITAVLFIIIFKKRKPQIYFYHYFIYILYFQVLSQGVFYFRQYTRGDNLFMLLCVLFYFVFYIVQNTFTSFELRKRSEEDLKAKKRYRITIHKYSVKNRKQ